MWIPFPYAVITYTILLFGVTGVSLTGRAWHQWLERRLHEAGLSPDSGRAWK